jgi:hypothetical protein
MRDTELYERLLTEGALESQGGEDGVEGRRVEVEVE